MRFCEQKRVKWIILPDKRMLNKRRDFETFKIKSIKPTFEVLISEDQNTVEFTSQNILTQFRRFGFKVITVCFQSKKATQK